MYAAAKSSASVCSGMGPPKKKEKKIRITSRFNKSSATSVVSMPVRGGTSSGGSVSGASTVSHRSARTTVTTRSRACLRKGKNGNKAGAEEVSSYEIASN